MYPWT